MQAESVALLPSKGEIAGGGVKHSISILEQILGGKGRVTCHHGRP